MIEFVAVSVLHVQMMQYRYLDNPYVHVLHMSNGTANLDMPAIHTYAITDYLDVSIEGVNAHTDYICTYRYLANIWYLQTSVEGLKGCCAQLRCLEP